MKLCFQVLLFSLPDFFENFTLPFSMNVDAKLYISVAAVVVLAFCVFADVHERISDHADKIADRVEGDRYAAYLGWPRYRRIECTFGTPGYIYFR